MYQKIGVVDEVILCAGSAGGQERGGGCTRVLLAKHVYILLMHCLVV